jgi:hypothetical protein
MSAKVTGGSAIGWRFMSSPKETGSDTILEAPILIGGAHDEPRSARHPEKASPGKSAPRNTAATTVGWAIVAAALISIGVLLRGVAL